MHDMTTEELILLLIKQIKEQKREDFQNIISELHPYDLADVYTTLPDKHRLKFTLFLTSKQIAILVQELEPNMQIDLLHKIGVNKSSKVMDLMENDDLADLLSEFSVEKIEEFLSIMKVEESQNVQSLMTYDPETAGGIMTNRYVWIHSSYTVREAVDKIKAFAKFAENIYYLYVLDEDKKLAGVISYRDLILADINDKVDSIMYSRVISVPANMDQEEVAQIIERYDFIAVPVVDEDKRLVGIVTVDDVIDVMIHEANENIDKMAATGKGIDFKTSAFTSTIRRLPWLLLLLVLGLISMTIISAFSDTLNSVLALAFFMPMIAGMTGNTGTQSLAIVIRGLASNDIDRPTVMRLIFREIGVGMMIGFICGILVFLATIIWFQDLDLGLVIGASLFMTLIIGTLVGTIIPLILYRFKIDPAIASGPLITTINDIFSLTVYFGLATLVLTQI